MIEVCSSRGIKEVKYWIRRAILISTSTSVYHYSFIIMIQRSTAARLWIQWITKPSIFTWTRSAHDTKVVWVTVASPRLWFVWFCLVWWESPPLYFLSIIWGSVHLREELLLLCDGDIIVRFGVIALSFYTLKTDVGPVVFYNWEPNKSNE